MFGKIGLLYHARFSDRDVIMHFEYPQLYLYEKDGKFSKINFDAMEQDATNSKIKKKNNDVHRIPKLWDKNSFYNLYFPI